MNSNLNEKINSSTNLQYCFISDIAERTLQINFLAIDIDSFIEKVTARYKVWVWIQFTIEIYLADGNLERPIYSFYLP